MSAQSIQPAFTNFPDIDGQPLEGGMIYIGTAGLAAATNQITVYWDSALTQAATQPIRTTGGYPMNSGSPGKIFVGAGDYSLTVNNKNNSLVTSSLNAVEGRTYTSAVDTISTLPTSSFDGGQISLTSFFSDTEGGGGMFYWDSSANKNTHNGGTIIDPVVANSEATTTSITGAYFTAGTGTGVWKRIYEGRVNLKWFGGRQDDDKTGLTGTDISASLNAALGVGNVYIPGGTLSYRLSASVSLPVDRSIFGDTGSFADEIGTIISMDPALADYALVTENTRNASTIKGISIDGNTSVVALGGIHLKDDGAGTNYGNRIIDVHVYDMNTSGAFGIKVEAWGTELTNVKVENIRVGNGVALGEGGVTGTTQMLNRCYIRTCDTALAIGATSISVSMSNCILESSIIGLVVGANLVSGYNLYMENMGYDPWGGSGLPGAPGSQQTTSRITIDKAGAPLAYPIYLTDFGAGTVPCTVNLYGFTLSGLYAGATKIFGLETTCVLAIHGGRLDIPLDDANSVVGLTSYIIAYDNFIFSCDPLATIYERVIVSDPVTQTATSSDGVASFFADGTLICRTAPQAVENVSIAAGTIYSLGALPTLPYASTDGEWIANMDLDAYDSSSGTGRVASLVFSGGSTRVLYLKNEDSTALDYCYNIAPLFIGRWK
jgi:hypothetical protein